MFITRRFFVLGASLIAVSAALAAESTSVEFKTQAARDAESAYSSTMRKIEGEYGEKAAAARKNYVSALTAAQQKATKAGNLDEAIRIRDAAARVQNEANLHASPTAPAANPVFAARADLTHKLSASVWNSGNAEMKFNADGTASISDSNDAWKWIAISGNEIVIVSPSGWIDKFHFDESLKNFSYQEYGNGSPRDNLRGVRLNKP